MFYLTTHSTYHSYMNVYKYVHTFLLNNNTISPFLINGHIMTRNYFQLRKEGNILFNDALDTFYLWLYGVRHMGKDHSGSKRGNLLPPPHELLFPFSSKVFLYAPFHRITPVVEHWLELEIG